MNDRGAARSAGRKPDSRPGSDRADFGSERTIREAVSTNLRLVDLGVLGLLPGLLVLVFVLPPTVQDSWRLAVLEPTFGDAYLSHFVHGSRSHLAANLGGYVLLAPLTYLLCLSAGRRDEFLAVLAAFTLGLPFVLSGLNVAIPRPSVGFGFSGIVMALLGFVPLAVGWHVETHFDAVEDDRFGPLGFLLGVVVIVAIGPPFGPLTLLAGFLAVAAGVAYLGSTAVAAGGLRRVVARRDFDEPWRIELAVAGFLVVAAFPFAAFPADVASAGVVTNLFEHAMGYCLGFVAPYAAFHALEHPGSVVSSAITLPSGSPERESRTG